jgi:hypothetical protein
VRKAIYAAAADARINSDALFLLFISRAAHPCLPHQEDKNLNGAIISRFSKTEVSALLTRHDNMPLLFLQPIESGVSNHHSLLNSVDV